MTAAKTPHIARYLRDNWAFTSQFGTHGTVRRAALMSRWVGETLSERALDRYYTLKGTETSVRGPEYAQSGLRYGYKPTPWLALAGMFPRGSLTRDDVVIEYGCGKGRTLAFLASRFPLRRLTGIEIEHELCEAARANLGHLTRRKCPWEVLCADATTFQVPDDVTAAYFYNPFRGEVFEAVLGRLRESLKRRPRPLRIIYYHSIMHDAVIAAGFTLERHKPNRSWIVQEDPWDPASPPGASWTPPYSWAIYRAGVMPESETRQARRRS